jgi:hypothetical protein
MLNVIAVERSWRWLKTEAAQLAKCEEQNLGALLHCFVRDILGFLCVPPVARQSRA